MLTRPAVLSMLLLSIGPLEAQVPDPGTPIRLWSQTPHLRRQRFTIEQVRGDTLVLRRELTRPSQGVVFVPTDGIQRLEVRVPRSRGRGAGHGAVMGGLTGLALGLVVGIAGAAADNTGGEGPGSALLLLFAPPVGFASGLLVGTVVGAVSPGERWACHSSRQCMPHAKIGHRVPEPRPGLALAFSF